MKVTIAKTAGFCMGVRRAVEMALDAANRSHTPIYTYGPLIHNPQVLSILDEKDIAVIDEIPVSGSGIVIVRAHGVPPQDKQALKDAGFDVIDATCPRVIRVQSIISKHARQGYAIIIIGDRQHPEVRGLLGYAGNNGYVVDSLQALQQLPDFENAIIVAQTTQNTVFFEAVRQWIGRHHPKYKVFNTICDSTEKRQAEVKAMASAVDSVIVVGGYNSGNTRRLAETARRAEKSTLHVETADDLDVEELSAATHIGITAGASTPNWIIKQVYQDLETRLMQKGGRLRRWGYTLMRNLMMSNLYVAAGGAGLAVAGAWLQGLSFHLSWVLIAALYILSMHTVNHMLERKSDRYNEPYRAEFYQKNRYALSVLAAISGVGALVTAYRVGPLFFFLLLCMCVLGLLYNVEFKSRDGEKIGPRLKDLPGSKTVLTALAWGIVVALFPVLDARGGITAASAVVFFWSSALVLVRTAYFDIIDMQGSRIVGRETIPILLGAHRTLRLLKTILIAMVLLLPVAGLLGIISMAGSLLSLCPAAMWGFLQAYEHGRLFPATRQGFIMESHFVAAGVLAGIGMLFF
ncbi:MAG: 4-hydroxy-3-methylbut-2-enyl diphosphate reductase [Thermodesulfobacteriota bacterium]